MQVLLNWQRTRAVDSVVVRSCMHMHKRTGIGEDLQLLLQIDKVSLLDNVICSWIFDVCEKRNLHEEWVLRAIRGGLGQSQN